MPSHDYRVYAGALRASRSRPAHEAFHKEHAARKRVGWTTSCGPSPTGRTRWSSTRGLARKRGDARSYLAALARSRAGQS